MCRCGSQKLSSKPLPRSCSSHRLVKAGAGTPCTNVPDFLNWPVDLESDPNYESFLS